MQKSHMTSTGLSYVTYDSNFHMQTVIQLNLRSTRVEGSTVGAQLKTLKL